MSERFYVAGFKFHGGVSKMLKGKMEAGEIVELVHDPNNKHDENAIEIYHGPTMVGFVPKAINQKILEQLEDGKGIGIIYKTNSDAAKAEPWKALQIDAPHQLKEEE